jgi:hypothetical protein
VIQLILIHLRNQQSFNANEFDLILSCASSYLASIFIIYSSEFLVCFATVLKIACYLLNLICQAHKLTLYVRPGLLITLERELLVDGHRSAAAAASAAPSPHVRPGATISTHSNLSGSGNGSVRGGGGVVMPSTLPRQQNEVEDYPGLPVHEGVMSQLMNCEVALSQLGTGLLVYLLLSELTRMMGSVLDLYARCLAHLQRIVDLRRVTHKRRLKVSWLLFVVVQQSLKRLWIDVALAESCI